MKAMILSGLGDLKTNRNPLEFRDVPEPIPREGEILIRVSTCGVCHTEIDEIEGRTPPPRFPVIPGHQIVGRVAGNGRGASRFKAGDRVGVAWIYSACGNCRFCRGGRENLCPDFKATGRDADGGYAEAMVVPEKFAYPIPGVFSDSEAAPLLCAGAVGFRSLKLAGLEDGGNLGLTGFGASGHLVIQAVRRTHPRSRIFVFARSPEQRELALALGAAWAGNIGEDPGERMQAVIDTTPAWKPVVRSLRHLERGGRLVINAIGKEDADKDELLDLDYTGDLWMEKSIVSTANVTRSDVAEFLKLAAEIPIRPEVVEFDLEEANRALLEIRHGKSGGAKVLRIG
jgi:alcohol dehydrogenase, propanol-preferring